MIIDATDTQRIVPSRLYAAELDSKTAVIECQTYIWLTRLAISKQSPFTHYVSHEAI